MGGSCVEAARRLDRAQKIIEYSLAVLVPGLIALMLYSYLLFDALFQPLFIITLASAAALMVPAYQALRSHYECWSKNRMPQRMVTGLVGIIYITAASTFGASLISASEGLDPGKPLTFAVFAGLAVALIAVMAYGSKNKDRFEHMDIRFYHRPRERTVSEVQGFLGSRSEGYELKEAGRRTTVVLARAKVTITVTAQPGGDSEVIIECLEPAGTELCDELKKCLDRR